MILVFGLELLILVLMCFNGTDYQIWLLTEEVLKKYEGKDAQCALNNAQVVGFISNHQTNQSRQNKTKQSFVFVMLFLFVIVLITCGSV